MATPVGGFIQERTDFTLVPNPPSGYLFIGIDLDSELKTKDWNGVVRSFGSGGGTVSGTPSQIAYFGDDGLLTSNDGFIWQSLTFSNAIYPLDNFGNTVSVIQLLAGVDIGFGYFSGNAAFGTGSNLSLIAVQVDPSNGETGATLLWTDQTRSSQITVYGSGIQFSIGGTTYHFPDSYGSNGDVLTSDGLGNLTFSAPGGGSLPGGGLPYDALMLGTGSIPEWDSTFRYSGDGKKSLALWRTAFDSNDVASFEWNARILYGPSNNGAGSDPRVSWGGPYGNTLRRPSPTGAGTVSVDWEYAQLKNKLSGDIVLDWDQERLYHNGLTVMDWANLALYSGGVTSSSWVYRKLFSNSNQSYTLDWDLCRLLTGAYGAESTTVDWFNGVLYTTGGAFSMNWSNKTLYGPGSTITADWGNSILYNGVTSSVNWDLRSLVNSSGVNVMAWNNSILNDNSNVASIAWSSRLTADSVGKRSIDWNGRYLHYDDESVAVSWAGGHNLAITASSSSINSISTFDGTYSTGDGKVVTVTKGFITSVV